MLFLVLLRLSYARMIFKSFIFPSLLLTFVSSSIKIRYCVEKSWINVFARVLKVRQGVFGLFLLHNGFYFCSPEKVSTQLCAPLSPFPCASAGNLKVRQWRKICWGNRKSRRRTRRSRGSRKVESLLPFRLLGNLSREGPGQRRGGGGGRENNLNANKTISWRFAVTMLCVEQQKPYSTK